MCEDIQCAAGWRLARVAVARERGAVTRSRRARSVFAVGAVREIAVDPPAKHGQRARTWQEPDGVLSQQYAICSLHERSAAVACSIRSVECGRRMNIAENEEVKVVVEGGGCGRAEGKKSWAKRAHVIHSHAAVVLHCTTHFRPDAPIQFAHQRMRLLHASSSHCSESSFSLFPSHYPLH